MEMTEQDFTQLDLGIKQFKQLKQLYTSEQIDSIKTRQQKLWNKWKQLILAIYETRTSDDLAKPYIESWTNGWQLKGHFYATFKSPLRMKEATCISLLWNHQYLKIGVEWRPYKAATSPISVFTHNERLMIALKQIENDAAFAEAVCWTSDRKEFDPFLKWKDHGSFCEEMKAGNGLGIGFVIEKQQIDEPEALLTRYLTLLEKLYRTNK